MNVLSLFDGMSCGQVALNRIGIKVEKYYASEIDKHAIAVTQANFPNTIQLGDVTKWAEWDLDWSKIDLLIAGSPCQGFSFSGKQLAFDDPRSKLFFVFSDVLSYLKWANPEIKFLLENVRMKKEFLTVITSHLEVPPLFINSALVSAQSRPRFYWCNWKTSEPEDRGILLNDVLLNGPDEETVGRLIGRYILDGKRQDRNGVSVAGKTTQRLEIRGDGKSNTLSTVQKDNLVIKPNHLKRILTSSDVEKGFTAVNPKKAICMTARQYANWKGNYIKPEKSEAIRQLHPIECERLQTLPDNYTNHVSRTQRYKMIGNGWTVEVVAHLFKQGLKNEP